MRSPASWSHTRIDTYATDLATADRDQKLRLELPGNIHTQPRDEGGRLIIRVQPETSSRQEGCINLVIARLDDDRQSIWLDPKGDELQEWAFPAGCPRRLLGDLRHQ